MLTVKVMNLAQRPERWVQFQKEWSTCNCLKFQRVDAIPDTPGWRGLARTIQSKVIFQAKAEKMPFVALMEDDANQQEDFNERFPMILKWLKQNDKWDVFYGGYSHPEFETFEVLNDSPRMIKGKFVTGHFLIIHERFYDTILNNYIDNISDLWIRDKSSFCVASVPMLSRQTPSFSNLRNRIEDYTPTYDEAEIQIDWASHQFLLKKHKKQTSNWVNIFFPRYQIFFSSFDAYNTKQFSHSKRFVELAKSIPVGKVAVSKLLPPKADWVFADQYMLPHAKEYADNIGCRFGAVVAGMWQFEMAGNDADVVIDLSTDLFHWRKNFLTLVTTNSQNIENLENPMIKQMILILPTGFNIQLTHPKLKIIFVDSVDSEVCLKEANKVNGPVLVCKNPKKIHSKEITTFPEEDEIIVGDPDDHRFEIEPYQVNYNLFYFIPPLKTTSQWEETGYRVRELNNEILFLPNS